MYYTDSHIHLQDYNEEDIENIIKNTEGKNVKQLVCVSAHFSDWQKVFDLSERYPQVIPAFGIHPWYTENLPYNWLEILEQYLQQNPRAFVGECGIDRLKNPNVEAQIEIFKPQIELAKKYHRPLIIHSVKANNEMQNLFNLMPIRTVFHSFTGSTEWGKEIQKHGFYIGLNQSIFRKKNWAEIIRNLDIHKILLETDGPYQPFAPNNPSVPQNIPLIAEKIADTLQISLYSWQEILFNNWKNFISEEKK